MIGQKSTAFLLHYVVVYTNTAHVKVKQESHYQTDNCVELIIGIKQRFSGIKKAYLFAQRLYHIKL